MEGGTKSGSSISDLFKAKEPSPDWVATYNVLYRPFSSIDGQASSEIEKKSDSQSQSHSAKSGGDAGKNTIGCEGQSQGTLSRDLGSYFQEEKMPPWPYSSSIYYGGQDIVPQPKGAQNPDYAKFKKDGEEDDSEKASRGDWWRGSLYY